MLIYAAAVKQLDVVEGREALLRFDVLLKTKQPQFLRYCLYRSDYDIERLFEIVAGIWKALQIVYSDAALADGWVLRPNRFFAGQTPLARMTAGDVTDLAAVRAYVDAARAPWS